MDDRTLMEIQERSRQAAGCRENGDIPVAIVHMEKALELVPDNEGIIRAKLLSTYGLLQAEAKNLTGSIESFQRARSLFQDGGNLVAMAIQTGNIGSVYRDTGDFDLRSPITGKPWSS